MARLRADLEASVRQVADMKSAVAASDARAAALTGDLEAMTARLHETLSEAEVTVKGTMNLR